MNVQSKEKQWEFDEKVRLLADLILSPLVWRLHDLPIN